MELTVGYVAGMVAAGFFLANLVGPNALALIVSWRLKDKNTAATWSVAGNALQRSHWPYVLFSDSVYSNGVSGSILWLSRLMPFVGILFAVGSIVTPLGLSSAILPDDDVRGQFVYAVDPSPFGYGTPPRSNYSWSRICGSESLLVGPRPCPFSDTIVIITHFPNGTVDYDYPYSINTAVPDVIFDTYSSGTSDNTTVSNYFDIQWRRYATMRARLFDNGTDFLVADNRNMESLVLTNKIQPVEGLVVNAIDGGVGFRNHTVPPGFKYGVKWEEDLLFVQPETVCVDTNLTLDFTINASPENSTDGTSGLFLTDRGGFINMNRTYPEPDLTDPQANADLYGRAYKAAWLHNWFTALYFNVTNPHNKTSGQAAFQYLNSEINKTFVLTPLISIAELQYLTLSPTFGDYVKGVPNITDMSSFNPFGITSENYTDISILCAGAGGGDYANITNILVACGQMRSVPQRTSPGSSLVPDDGSSWTQKIYTCASASKASIKTVSFTYNSTNGLFPTLEVAGIRDKNYTDNESGMPLWGVENVANAYLIADLNLVWGLVSEDQVNNVNVSTVRQPHLYLPGYFDPNSASIGATFSWENMPGSDFSVGALSAAYTVDTSSTIITNPIAGIDYTGAASLSMWARWQQLTGSAETASLVPNLIFTDIAASTVVGTKGALGPGNAGGSSGSEADLPVIEVTPMYSTVQYDLLYAVPAILGALVLVVIVLAALVALTCGGARYHRMRRQLQQTASGRIFTAFLYAGPTVLTMKPSEWSDQFGDKAVDLSGEYPVAEEMLVPQAAAEEEDYKKESAVVTVSDGGWSQQTSSMAPSPSQGSIEAATPPSFVQSPNYDQYSQYNTGHVIQGYDQMGQPVYYMHPQAQLYSQHQNWPQQQ
ncbi:hypothetical protein BX600DRAFT_548781 [Xylariales sp. PMI_506]|nr:hypothetical protein BX600DRAFT_548781 [Xylariales sp. PMI_506]